MDERTLKALRGSIEKWEKIVARTGSDDGIRNCPLCRLFYEQNGRQQVCVGCPVYEKTGWSGCVGTPHGLTVVVPTNSPEYDRLAQMELDFLRSLLPEGER